MFGWTFKIKAGNLNYFSSFKTVFKKREKKSVYMVYVFLSIIHQISSEPALVYKVQMVTATFLHAVLTCFWTKL